ncbi:DUF4082 domain-containing protein [Microbispora sp. H10885]|uniref:DUF4082 domain-containing protein n=1 Tax=Microbispora sp. H10885 TaxID=2729110 RepID=UPI001600FAAA|nr:DUF4082 domain-containing protein [Microbispora sp. H10885]
MVRSSRRASGRRSRLPGLVSLLAACAVGGVAVTVALTSRSPETSLGPTVPVAQERVLQASFAPESQSARTRRDPMPVEVGMRFVPQVEGQVVALRFLKARGDSGRHIGSLWSDRGALLARVTFRSETSRGWQEARLSAPVALEAGRTYTVSYNSGAGRYVAQRGVFTQGPLEVGPLVAPAERNGVFSYGRPSFPRRSNPAGYNYFVDVVFRYTTVVPDPAGEEGEPPASDPTEPPQKPAETPGAPVTPAYPDDTATTTPAATPTVTVPVTPPVTPRVSPRVTPTTGPGRSATPTATSEPSSKPTQAPPPANGFPDASTTGPAKGTVFTRMKGGELRQNGAVYDGVEFTDAIDVYADNVTLRNCRIITTGEWGVQLRNGHGNLVVDHCEIAGDGRRQLAVAVKNIGDGDITIRGNDIHDATDAINTGRGTIEGNYIHDLRAFTGDHVDGIQTEGSSGSAPLVIKNNTILNPVGQTSAIMLATSLGPVTNVLIQGNLIGGGGYCFYGGGDKAGSSRNVVVRDNVFSRSLFSNCGAYGPVAHFDRSAPGNVWQNNVWQGTRTTVEL